MIIFRWDCKPTHNWGAPFYICILIDMSLDRNAAPTAAIARRQFAEAERCLAQLASDETQDADAWGQPEPGGSVPCQ